MTRRTTIMLTSVSLLTACSAYQSEFRCPTPTGVACRSLQQVYKAETTRPPLPPAPDPQRVPPAAPMEEWTPPVKSLWIAPYIDNAGRRHEASLVRLVVFPGPRATAAEPEFLIPPIPESTETGDLLVPPPPPPTSSVPSPRSTGSPSRAMPSRGGASPALPQNLFMPPASKGATSLPGFGVPEQ
jgi:hypothetical protein